MKWIVAAAAALILSACSDPNAFTRDDKARAIARAQGHVDRMRDSEATVRALSDTATRAGRRRVQAAHELTQSAENMLDTVSNFQTTD